MNLTKSDFTMNLPGNQLDFVTSVYLSNRQCIYLQLMDMFIHSTSLCCNFPFLQVHISILSCMLYVFLMIWLGLCTKHTWLGRGKDCLSAENICTLLPRAELKMVQRPIRHIHRFHIWIAVTDRSHWHSSCNTTIFALQLPTWKSHHIQILWTTYHTYNRNVHMTSTNTAFLKIYSILLKDTSLSDNKKHVGNALPHSLTSD